MSENWLEFCRSWIESYTLKHECRIRCVSDDPQGGNVGGSTWSLDVMACFPDSANHDNCRNNRKFWLWLRWLNGGCRLSEHQIKRAEMIDQRFYYELRRKGLYGEAPDVLEVR